MTVDSRLDMASSISFSWVCVDNIFVPGKENTGRACQAFRERRREVTIAIVHRSNGIIHVLQSSMHLIVFVEGGAVHLGETFVVAGHH